MVHVALKVKKDSNAHREGEKSIKAPPRDAKWLAWNAACAGGQMKPNIPQPLLQTLLPKLFRASFLRCKI